MDLLVGLSQAGFFMKQGGGRRCTVIAIEYYALAGEGRATAEITRIDSHVGGAVVVLTVDTTVNGVSVGRVKKKSPRQGGHWRGCGPWGLWRVPELQRLNSTRAAVL